MSDIEITKQVTIVVEVTMEHAEFKGGLFEALDIFNTRVQKANAAGLKLHKIEFNFETSNETYELRANLTETEVPETDEDLAVPYIESPGADPWD